MEIMDFYSHFFVSSETGQEAGMPIAGLNGSELRSHGKEAIRWNDGILIKETEPLRQEND